jgi:hypothetical protein
MQMEMQGLAWDRHKNVAGLIKNLPLNSYKNNNGRKSYSGTFSIVYFHTTVTQFIC